MASMSLEARVGAFVFGAVALALAFVWVLSDVGLGSRFQLYVDFAYSGQLQTGAPVKISGVRIGRVSELELLGPDAQPAPATERERDLGRRQEPLVRATLALQPQVAERLTQQARFAVSTQGIIGEAYVEVAPAPGAKLEPAVAVRGVDAPRVHRMALQLAQVLDATNRWVRVGSSGQLDLKALAGGLASLLQTIDEVVGQRRQMLGETLDDVAVAAAQLKALTTELRSWAQPGRRMLEQATQLADVMGEEFPRLLADTRRSMARLRQLLDGSDAANEEGRLQTIMAQAERTTRNLEAVSQRAQAIMARIERGEGSVGGLVRDPQLYDDLKQLLRDLKRNPWKIFWKE